jgi:hypothetical protein
MSAATQLVSQQFDFTGAAWHALAAFAPERMYNDPRQLSPPLDPWLAAQGWQIVFYVTGEDALLRRCAPLARLDGQRVFYGFLAAKGVDLLLAIRGTAGMEEWAIDAEFLHRRHKPSGGYVEDGFAGVNDSLLGDGGVDLVAAVQRVRPHFTSRLTPGRMTLVGHSLGATLATMKAGEFGKDCDRLRVYASPLTGDATYASWVMGRVPNEQGWAYERDRVPFVPLTIPRFRWFPSWAQLQYTALPGRRMLPAVPWIVPPEKSLSANHHAWCYAGLIDIRAIYHFDPGPEYLPAIIRSLVPPLPPVLPA